MQHRYTCDVPSISRMRSTSALLAARSSSCVMLSGPLSVAASPRLPPSPPPPPLPLPPPSLVPRPTAAIAAATRALRLLLAETGGARDEEAGSAGPQSSSPGNCGGGGGARSAYAAAGTCLYTVRQRERTFISALITYSWAGCFSLTHNRLSLSALVFKKRARREGRESLEHEGLSVHSFKWAETSCLCFLFALTAPPNKQFPRRT